MTAIVEHVCNNESLCQSVSSYIDDLFIDENVVSVTYVKKHLEKWGLVCKEPEKIGFDKDVRVLGLKIHSDFTWHRDGILLKKEAKNLSKREMHSIIGELIGHFPVCGWLRVACSYLQRIIATEHSDWDDQVSKPVLEYLNKVYMKIDNEGDPVKGNWIVSKTSPITIWCDASNLALGVSLEIDGDIVEDGAWLRPKNDSMHINRSELEAAIKGINLALKWGKRKMLLKTDSKCVYGWLLSILERTHNVRTKALSEVLIRRRLSTLKELIFEKKNDIKVEIVASENNKADALTRVPGNWIFHDQLDSACIGVYDIAKNIHT